MENHEVTGFTSEVAEEYGWLRYVNIVLSGFCALNALAYIVGYLVGKFF